MPAFVVVVGYRIFLAQVSRNYYFGTGSDLFEGKETIKIKTVLSVRILITPKIKKNNFSLIFAPS